MPHSLPLITTIAAALGLSLIMGFIAVRMKLPTLVGYLVAGVIIGPFTPGFVANAEIASELAEIGVMLLMFGVGLHFSLDHLLEMRKIALSGALIQIAVATFLGTSLAMFWGWDIGGALVFGLALSVASTVVLIRALEEHNMIGSLNGQIAISWLIFEDLAMVLVLVFLPLIAEWYGGGTGGNLQKNGWLILGLTLFKITTFILLMLLIGRRALPKLLLNIARTGSRDLFTLAVIATAVGIAFTASKLFGMSFALGAFFAGMIMRESKFSRRAAEESLPFRDAFAVLFFVSVGMLFNPNIFIEQPLAILSVVIIIVIGKSITAAALVLAFGYPLYTALVVSASLAQIGEFSFILAGLGVHLGLLSPEGQGLILGGALISITLNPFVFKLIEPLQFWLRFKSFKKIEVPPLLLTHDKYLSGQVVLVGYGSVGGLIERTLAKKGMSYVVVEQDRELVKQLRIRNISAVLGDATEPDVLIQAKIASAGMLVVAISDTFIIKQVINAARELNPKIEIAIKTQSEDEALSLSQEIEGKIFFNDRELANGMSRYILARFGVVHSE